MSPLIVAIDGPSGAGKTTASRGLASRLSVPYLDTGAMYRTVALAVIEAAIDPEDRGQVEAALSGFRIVFDIDRNGLTVRLDGGNVASRIRTDEVSAATSRVATHPKVRQTLVERQRELAQRYGAVVEGRDIGTAVFPEASHKFFLDASAEVRANRRRRELVESGESVTVESVGAELAARDRRDTERPASPLRIDGSYRRIDTSELCADEVVELMLAQIDTDGVS